MIEILKKPAKHRTEQDLDRVIPYMQDVQFFKEREIKAQDFPDIVDALKYEYFEGDEVIF
jgi:hypothetical protein